MPYGNKMPKKMGCSGGGPNMYKVGSKEKNTPMNFSDKAMKYMKNMPAMYKNKPMMEGDPEKIKSAADKLKKDNVLRKQGTQKPVKNKLRDGVAISESGKSTRKRLKEKLGRNPTIAEYNAAAKKGDKLRVARVGGKVGAVSKSTPNTKK